MSHKSPSRSSTYCRIFELSTLSEENVGTSLFLTPCHLTWACYINMGRNINCFWKTEKKVKLLLEICSCTAEKVRTMWHRWCPFKRESCLLDQQDGQATGGRVAGLGIHMQHLENFKESAVSWQGVQIEKIWNIKLTNTMAETQKVLKHVAKKSRYYKCGFQAPAVHGPQTTPIFHSSVL